MSMDANVNIFVNIHVQFSWLYTYMCLGSCGFTPAKSKVLVPEIKNRDSITRRIFIFIRLCKLIYPL
jgi:hypothetical protein